MKNAMLGQKLSTEALGTRALAPHGMWDGPAGSAEVLADTPHLASTLQNRGEKHPQPTTLPPSTSLGSLLSILGSLDLSRWETMLFPVSMMSRSPLRHSKL